MSIFVDASHVSRLVELQHQLLKEFSAQYPRAKDTEWLLDFPKKGTLVLDGAQWDFLRHGSGIRFTRTNPAPNCIVDIHKRIDNPDIFDEWRLFQFLDSSGVSTTEQDVTTLLRELGRLGRLTPRQDGFYVLRRRPP